jgi:uncharacterized protein (DUF433 family)
MSAQQTVEQTGSQDYPHSNGNSAAPNREALILRDPDIMEGKPFLRGTRMGVHALIGYWLNYKGSYDLILKDFPHLSRELIDAALDYYSRNPAEKAEIDGILEANARHYQQRLLVQRGLVSNFPDRNAPRPPRPPRIKSEGPPLSEIIIEERR